MSLRKSLFGSATMLGIAGMLALSGCSSSKDGKNIGGDHARGEYGGLGLGLELPDGSEVSTVTYTITRNGSEVETGTIEIGTDGRASKLITGLEAGDGYSVTLSAARGSDTPCTGSANFTVVADMTTTVDVVLSCDDAGGDTGSVQINGTFNICPRITAASFSPATQSVGGVIAITSAATDRETPAAIAFAWTATDGTFSAPSASATNYTCATAGEKTLTLSVTDGTGAAACTRSKTYTVTCTGSAPVEDAGVDSATPEVDSSTPEQDSSTPEQDSSTPEQDSSTPVVDSGSSGPNACDECIAANCSLYQGEIDVVSLCSDSACQQVLDCVEMADCATSSGNIGDCFCGTAIDPGQCVLSTFEPTGACREIIATNLGLENTPANRLEITARYVNPEYATGRAMQYYSCELDNCNAPCAQYR